MIFDRRFFEGQPSPPPPPPPWWLPLAPSNNNTFSGVRIAILTVALGMFLLVVTCFCKLSIENRAAAADADAAEAAAVLSDEGRPRRDPTAGLPSFAYSSTEKVRHNVVDGSGDEPAATCSVSLGVFQAGETVRLLPVCQHLYHVDCIDPWLHMHSTCPICRSGTNPSKVDGILHPPPV